MVGGGVKSFSCQTQLRLCSVELWLGWGFDNIIPDPVQYIVSDPLK